MKTFLIGIIAFVLGGVIAGYAVFKLVPLNDIKTRAEVLQSDDKVWFLQHSSEVFPTRTVARAPGGMALPQRAGALEGFSFEWQGETRTLADMYTDMETTGLIILHEGQIVHESYGRGADAATRFGTWSMVKSFTSTLVGFAVFDGLIDSVDDPLTQYLPALVGTAYDGVTIKQALQMSSGVSYDPELWQGKAPDTVKFITDSVITGKTPAFEIAKSFKRGNEPGHKFNYNTAESQILLELVRTVTGKDAAIYLQEKVWQPLGMQHDAAWVLDRPGADGAEIGGALFNATLRDWARFGQFIEQNGSWNGAQLLPADWVARATVSDDAHLKPGIVHPNPNRGYAWHWWTYADGTFTASGANGQTLYIDDDNDIVVARASAWPKGYVMEYDDESYAMYKALANWLAIEGSDRPTEMAEQ